MDNINILNLIVALIWAVWIPFLIIKDQVTNVQFGIVGAVLVFNLLLTAFR